MLRSSRTKVPGLNDKLWRLRDVESACFGLTCGIADTNFITTGIEPDRPETRVSTQVELPAVVPGSSERTIRFDTCTARRHGRLDTSQPVGVRSP